MLPSSDGYTAASQSEMGQRAGRGTHVAVVALLGAVVAVDGGPSLLLLLLLFLLLHRNARSSLSTDTQTAKRLRSECAFK